MANKLNIQKLAVNLSQEENQKLLQNIIDQSNIIKAAEQVTIPEQEKPKLDEEYVDSSIQWLATGAVASKNNS